MNKIEQKRWIQNNILIGKSENITAEKIIYILTEIIDNGIDLPSNESTTYHYPYIVGFNRLGETAKLNAKDLGKNFANTDLHVKENRKHTGPGTVDFAMPLIFSELSDKSADATFNQFALLDNNGNFAKATQIANAFEKALENTTAEQALRIGQLLNGGVGSSGTTSVNSILPPVISNNDEDFYVILRGANLYLNINSYSVSLINTENNSEYFVPQSNIQLYSDGISLVFYYNFSKIILGNYKIKLVSGSKIYITTLTFKLVNKANVDNIDFSKNIWEIIENTSNTNFVPYVKNITPTSLSFIRENSISKNTEGVQTSLKSSELFKKGENFVLELSYSTYVSPSLKPNYIGLMHSSTGNSFQNSNLNNISFRGWYWSPGSAGIDIYIKNTLAKRVNGRDSNHISGMVIIKENNLLTIISEGKAVFETISDNSGYSIGINLSQIPSKGEILTLNIEKAYKF